jgi:hypothetical protein
MIVILTKEDKRQNSPSNNDIHNFKVRGEVFYQAHLVIYFDEHNPNGLVLKDHYGEQRGRGYIQRP